MNAAILCVGKLKEKWQQEGVCHSGYALDVDDDGGLIVDTLQEQITISAGEVSVRPAQN